jgi:hypothetical protein
MPGTSACTYLARTLLALAFATTWVIHVPAEAQSTASFSGALRSEYFSSTRTLDDENDVVGAAAQLKGRYRPSEDLLLKFDARIMSPSLVRGDSGNAQLTEGYLSLQRGRWDWRLGKQVIAWGRADGLNPTDVVTPRDYTVLLPFDGDQREGTWAGSGTYAISPELGLTGLWKADFNPATVATPSGDRAAYEFTKPRPHSSQFGLRLNRAGGDIDWSVSVFRGHSLLPEAGADQPDPGVLRLTYPVVTMVGGDLAKSFSSFGTRVEVAYTDPRGSVRNNEPGLRRNLYLVAGVDRTFFPQLNVNLQLFTRRSWHLPEELDPQLAAAQGFNAATFMQQRQRVNGLTLRVSNAWLHDTLEAEVFVQRFFRDGDTFVQPLLSYAFSDEIKGTVGGQYYSGKGAQFGPMKRNRGVFAELRYSF